MQQSNEQLSRPLTTRHVMIAGVALVVAASTLVSDFNGYFALGWGFAIALILAGGINLLLAMSAADLAGSIPKAGALYEYSRAIFSGSRGVYIGIFLGLSFYIMYGFALSGEIAAGGYATQALLGSDADVRVFIVLLSICVIVPNVIGIKQTAVFSGLLLLFMIGIRWFFGLAGFLGWGEYETWSAANLLPEGGMPSLFGDGGILVAGLALAFWSFVGIEFACSLAEEVKDPQRSMPRGLIGGIFFILVTSMFMGIGVVGTAPLVDWQALATTDAACAGSCVQLAVGQQAFGGFGHSLMAIASITATLGTAAVGLAAMSRMLYAIGRDGLLFGPVVSAFFGKLNSKTGTPVNAIIFSGLLYIVPGFFNTEVVNLLYTAAYVWIIMYIAFHVLTICNRKMHPTRSFGMGEGYTPFAYIGVLATSATLYIAFYGAHGEFGYRAFIMLIVAAIIAMLSVAIRDRNVVAFN